MAGGETDIDAGFYGSLTPQALKLVLLVLLSIFPINASSPVLFDAGVGLGR